MFGRLLDRLSVVLLWVSVVALALVLVLINVEVVSRYFLNRSTLIADEYSGYAFAWILMCGFLYAHRHGSFLNVSVVTSALSQRPAAAFRAFGAALGVILCVVAGYGTWFTLSLSVRFSATSAFASETPLAIPQVALPLGFALLGFSFLEEFLSSLMAATSGNPADEGPR
ncbi:TRAP transporter small permease [Microbaculum marinum]|uniref:TRAP transporter small permease protein n=1 Tax=Microbaculum marinum TaxID=1764581 RepID=A0AAW9RAZ9_9HYPH